MILGSDFPLDKRASGRKSNISSKTENYFLLVLVSPSFDTILFRLFYVTVLLVRLGFYRKRQKLGWKGNIFSKSCRSIVRYHFGRAMLVPIKFAYNCCIYRLVLPVPDSNKY